MQRNNYENLLLPDVSDEVLLVVERPGTPLGELSKHFADPRDLFICAPQPIDLRTLASLYNPEGTGEHIRDMRTRCREERWREARAMFHSRRTSARREVLIEVEATTWAMLGVDFHMAKMRSLWDRWDMLSSSVLEQLARIESGERGFDTGLRDMCKELRDVERELSDVMPTMNLTDKAQQVWSGRAQSREDLVQSIGAKLNTIASGNEARNVFEIIEGGLDVSEG